MRDSTGIEEFMEICERVDLVQRQVRAAKQIDVRQQKTRVTDMFSADPRAAPADGRCSPEDVDAFSQLSCRRRTTRQHGRLRRHPRDHELASGRTSKFAGEACEGRRSAQSGCRCDQEANETFALREVRAPWADVSIFLRSQALGSCRRRSAGRNRQRAAKVHWL